MTALRGMLVVPYSVASLLMEKIDESQGVAVIQSGTKKRIWFFSSRQLRSRIFLKMLEV